MWSQPGCYDQAIKPDKGVKTRPDLSQYLSVAVRVVSRLIHDAVFGGSADKSLEIITLTKDSEHKVFHTPRRSPNVYISSPSGNNI